MPDIERDLAACWYPIATGVPDQDSGYGNEYGYAKQAVPVLYPPSEDQARYMVAVARSRVECLPTF